MNNLSVQVLSNNPKFKSFIYFKTQCGTKVTTDFYTWLQFNEEKFVSPFCFCHLTNAPSICTDKVSFVQDKIRFVQNKNFVHGLKWVSPEQKLFLSCGQNFCLGQKNILSWTKSFCLGQIWFCPRQKTFCPGRWTGHQTKYFLSWTKNFVHG